MATTKKKKVPANIVWFNVPADNLKRAQKFYSSLFGWKINPFCGMNDFLEIDTGGPDESPNGGLALRKSEGQHGITNFISVDSIDKYLAKTEKLGGRINAHKTAVPQMGYFAICQDSEANVFGLWETNAKAK